MGGNIFGPDEFIPSELCPAALRDHVGSGLFFIGDPALLFGPCISVTGSCRATPYGLAVSEMIGAECWAAGLTSIS